MGRILADRTMTVQALLYLRNVLEKVLSRDG